MAKQIRVVVADDYAPVREGLKLFLETDQGLTVVGEADSGKGAIAAVLRYRPDILLLDSEIQEGASAELVRSVKRVWSAVGVLALTTFPDDVYSRALLKAGAEGCVSKLDDPDTLVRTLWAVVAAHRKGHVRSVARRREHRRQLKWHTRQEMLPQKGRNAVAPRHPALV